MMGRAHVVTSEGVLARILRTQELFAQVEIHSAKPHGPGMMLLDLSSTLIDHVSSDYQDMSLDGLRLCFKHGDEFVPELHPGD